MAPHMVRMNQLVNELNREGRNTYNPNLDKIEGIAIEIEHEIAMIRRVCRWIGEKS